MIHQRRIREANGVGVLNASANLVVSVNPTESVGSNPLEMIRVSVKPTLSVWEMSRPNNRRCIGQPGRIGEVSSSQTL